MRAASDSRSALRLALRRCHSPPVTAASAALCKASTGVPSPLLPASHRRVPSRPVRPSYCPPLRLARSRNPTYRPFSLSGRPPARSETASTARSRISAPPAFKLPSLGPSISTRSRRPPHSVVMSLRGIPGRLRVAADVATCVFSQNRIRAPCSQPCLPLRTRRHGSFSMLPRFHRASMETTPSGTLFQAEIRSSPATLPLLASRNRTRSHPRRVRVDFGHPRPILCLRNWPF